MLPLERRRRIVEQISTNGSVKVIDLSKNFNVTEETIRRDLEKLEQENILKRTYGGAVLEAESGREVPFVSRSERNKVEKIFIGELASSLICDGDVIMVDSSTTSLEVVRKITGLRNLTLITNSVVVTSDMVHHDNIDTICTGGHLLTKALAYTGPLSEKIINSYYADKAILSCKGIGIEKGIMESNELEASIKRAMIETAEKVILVVDHTKFDIYSRIRLTSFYSIDIVVTNSKPSQEWLDFFDKMDIECIY